MAAEIDTGMDGKEMRKALNSAGKNGANCAFCAGDGGFALLRLDRSKGSSALAKSLKEDFGVPKVFQGRAFVDADNSKKVVFVPDGSVPGMAKKLLKTLKLASFKKVSIQTEDGAEDAEDEEEGAAQAATGEPESAAAAPAPAAGPEPAAPPAPAPAPTGPDFAALAQMLGDLVKSIGQVDPAAQDDLKRQAMQVGLLLKKQDPAAEDAIDDLSDAIAASPAPAAGKGNGAAPAGPSPAAVATYTKARVAWLATRQKVETDISKLQTTFASAFKDHAMAADLETAFQTRVETVLVKLDHELATKLDAAAKATDATQHAKLIGEARQAMQKYQDFVASDKTLTELDANPFVPLAIQKTLTATLSVLSKSLA